MSQLIKLFKTERWEHEIRQHFFFPDGHNFRNPEEGYFKKYH